MTENKYELANLDFPGYTYKLQQEICRWLTVGLKTIRGAVYTYL